MASNVNLTGLARDLAAREEMGKPIRIGLVGAGEMGTDIVTRVGMMEGIEVAAISEINIQNAHAALEIALGEQGHSTEVSTQESLNTVIKTGKTAVTENSDFIIGSGLIDVVVDATGIPSVGAEVGLKAMENGKHLVMMNVESDVTIGAFLRREAARNGVVYSLGAGDEPSACMELIEFAAAMGHKVICAGKGKNNPLNFAAVPDEYAAEAQSRNMNPRLLVEFVDGSKTAVEMAAIANATGLIPDCDGMHGPAASLGELATTLIPKCDGGILSDAGRVDYSIGKGVSPGVFVIVKAEHPRIWERLKDLKMGEGPYYTFHRPYHLTSLEVPLTCAKAVLYGKSDMVPMDRPVAEVCAIAKKDLAPGEKLGLVGEYAYRAWAMEVARARQAEALPAGLLTGAVITAPVRKGALITAQNAELPQNRLVDLRNRQDKLLYA